MIYHVKIPILVCDENNDPVDDADRSICAEIEADDADEAAQMFASYLFAEDSDDYEPPTVLS